MEVWTEILNVLVASVASLVALFFLTRLGGKRQIAQMSTFDYVNSITIGSIAAEMATNLEQWYRPLTALVIYGLAAWLTHFAAMKSIHMRLWLCGRSTVLLHNGTIFKNELARAGIDLNEFLTQARIAGYFDLNELQSAVLELNGQISFLPKSQNRPVTPEDLNLSPEPASTWIDLILDGQLMRENLQQSGHEDDWLNTQLHRQGIGQVSEVFYAACDKNGGFFACRGR